MSVAAPLVKHGLRFFERGGIAGTMSDERGTPAQARKAAEKLSREDRLAAKLRENLRRRKAQARALSAPAPDDIAINADGESVRLPKASPES